MKAADLDRMVTSMVGMGGVGKTTLAKKLYDNQKVRESFDCSSWITVSQSYKPKDILTRMIEQLYQSRKEPPPERIHTMDQNQLIGKLREYLHQKRYVIVLDDVWRTDFWGFIKHALPKNCKGSRVIITTRSKEVAAFCKESSMDHVHELQRLSEKSAWKLFCKKAFRLDSGGRCPPELDKVSHEIVRKCEGLPLAIVAIGGLLSAKNKVASEWKTIYHSLGSQLERNPHLSSITRILLLSYYDMPYYLRACFLYFGMMPEDYSILPSRLIHLWIAEGFIEHQRGKTLEEVGREYLIELHHRSLIQVSRTGIGGSMSVCRVHDIVREIILSKSEELSFYQVLAEEGSSLNCQTRRLSVHMQNINEMEKVLECTSKSRIHSFLLFARREKLKKPNGLAIVFKNFKLLKVLDLQDAPNLDHLPKQVGNLLHLRHLSLRNTKVKIIPKSIGKLKNLLTLDLYDSLVSKLPISINKLPKLQNLLISSHNPKSDILSGTKLKGGIGQLEDLQKLRSVEANHEGTNSSCLVKELQNLRQLRELGILKLKRGDGQALCSAIENMKNLKILMASTISEDECLDLHYLSSPPEYLHELQLGGRLEKFPKWIPKLQNLAALFLHWSGLIHHPLKHLQALPHLQNLNILDHSYDGEQLRFEVGGFQKL